MQPLVLYPYPPPSYPYQPSMNVLCPPSENPTIDAPSSTTKASTINDPPRQLFHLYILSSIPILVSIWCFAIDPSPVWCSSPYGARPPFCPPARTIVPSTSDNDATSNQSAYFGASQF